MLRIQNLKQDRSGDTGYNDQQNDCCKVFRTDHSHRQSLLCYDQGNLASGHHTDTDFQGIRSFESADSRHQTTTDDLAQQSNNNKSDREQYKFSVQMVKAGLKSDTCEENRPEYPSSRLCIPNPE